jgi:ribosomal protein S18 acetylase RimI-like enzyme
LLPWEIGEVATYSHYLDSNAKGKKPGIGSLQTSAEWRCAMENFEGYPKKLTLKNGLRLEIGILNEQKREGLLRFFQQVPKEDVQFCKEDVKDPKIVGCWLQAENCRRIMTLVAEDVESKQIVACLNLCRGMQAARVIGEIQQMLVAPSLQGLGLGSLMLDEMISLAEQENLRWLKVEVMNELRNVIKALKSRGFEIKTILEDYFIDQKDTAYDVALMMRRL